MREERTPVRSEAGREKVSRVMGEFKRGSLRSGSGHAVTGRKQAVAIALSEGRRVQRRARRHARRV